MNALRLWIQGARLRTLPLSIGPVFLGSSLADFYSSFDLSLCILAVLVAIFLQVGVNFANDYSDGIRGTDDFRVGPARLTSSGLADASRVRNAALVALLLAVLCGLVVILITGNWWLTLVGLLSISGAWFYTGGSKPYGYAGLGEVSAFVFFGPVATLGTAFIMIGKVPPESWLVGATAGFFAAAALLINNIRDENTDFSAHKTTLAVRLGRYWSLRLLAALLILPYIILGTLSFNFLDALFVALLFPLTLAIILACFRASNPNQLVRALGLISLNGILFALALGLAIII